MSPPSATPAPDAAAGVPSTRSGIRPTVRLLFAAVLIGAGLLALPALAPVEEAPTESPTTGPGGVAPPSDPHALALLRRAASVGVSRSWRGEEVVAMAGSASTAVLASVEHRALVGTETAVVSGAGESTERMFDPDDAVLDAISPASGPLEVTSAGGRWAVLLTNGYAASVGASDEVAGLSCTVLAVRRRDGSTAAKIWVSDDLGLALQRQVFDSRGTLLRYSTYTRIALVPDEAVADVEAGLRAAGHQDPASGGGLSLAALTGLAGTGETAPRTLAGALQLVDARRYAPSGAAAVVGGVSSAGSGTSAGILQLTYSDGLSSVTVSEERGRLSRRLPTGWVIARRAGSDVRVRPGLPERVAWADHGLVFTLVSDTDDATIDAMLAQLPRPRATVGYLARMRQGLDQVGHWLTPGR